MTYVEQVWNDYDPSYPASAARFLHMETGIGDAHDALAALETVSIAGGLRGEAVPAAEPAVWSAASRTIATAGRTWLLRFCPRRTWNITLARWDVTTAASTDDTVEVAIYNSDLTSRIATSGVQSGQLIGTVPIVRGVNITATVTPANVYYVAFKQVTLGGTGATINGRTTNSNTLVTIFGTTVPSVLGGFVDGLSNPLPTSISSGSVTSTAVNTYPLIVLREV